jgi:hypothetical protein
VRDDREHRSEQDGERTRGEELRSRDLARNPDPPTREPPETTATLAPGTSCSARLASTASSTSRSMSASICSSVAAEGDAADVEAGDPASTAVRAAPVPARNRRREGELRITARTQP